MEHSLPRSIKLKECGKDSSDGITGGPLPSGSGSRTNFWAGWTPGNNIREKSDKITNGIANFGKIIDGVKAKVKFLLMILLGGGLSG